MLSANPTFGGDADDFKGLLAGIFGNRRAGNVSAVSHRTEDGEQ